MELDGQVAIVTGAGRGIGRAIALELAGMGAGVVVAELNGESAGRVAAEVRALGRPAVAQPTDVTRADQRQALVERTLAEYGRIDVLVNNAGIGVKPAAPVAEMPLDAWQRMIRAHLDSTFLWSRAVVPAMRAGGYGRIVNTSSMNFTGGGRPGVAHYSAAKAGIVGLTQTMAREVGRDGITVNAIAPGYVATELISQFSDDMMQRLQRQNPVGRLCSPDEVAALVAWLCSVHAGFVSGECICMDGARRDFFWG